jgi:hypothetical protein
VGKGLDDRRPLSVCSLHAAPVGDSDLLVGCGSGNKGAMEGDCGVRREPDTIGEDIAGCARGAVAVNAEISSELSYTRVCLLDGRALGVDNLEGGTTPLSSPLLCSVLGPVGFLMPWVWGTADVPVSVEWGEASFTGAAVGTLRLNLGVGRGLCPCVGALAWAGS